MISAADYGVILIDSEEGGLGLDVNVEVDIKLVSNPITSLPL